MKDRLSFFLFNIYKKYNELVVSHIILLPIFFIFSIGVYWFCDGLMAFEIIVATALFYFVPIIMVNKSRTCPRCHTWIYSTCVSADGVVTCKKCDANHDN